ncbi:MAG: bifunctional folylpolyglutamate synthase/dihydrofolate synthase, partial [Desulfobulbia bacterium]
LESLHPRSIDLSLDRVYRLAELLGHPETALPEVVHVAGTNGKGSVIAFLEAMLRAEGNKVHVFNSPHLLKFHERIRLDGSQGSQPISEENLIEVLQRAHAANAGLPITFFEITTLAAFLAFSENPAEYLLLETGLGGRLDATNIVTNPKLTIITPVSIDHTSFLGNSILQIAAEKAGILKQGIPCVLSPQNIEAYDVIASKAEQLSCRLIAAGRDWDVYEQAGRLIYQEENSLQDLPLPRLVGRHQLENAGTAISAFKYLSKSPTSDHSIEQGLLLAKWPGRLELLELGALHKLVCPGTEIWVDGGHNPAAGQVIARSLAELEDRAPKPLQLIVGMMNNKNVSEFVEGFDGLAEFVATIPITGTENSHPAQTIAEISSNAGLNSRAFGSLEEALKACNCQNSGPVRILICGSLYLAGGALRLHGENNK